MSIEAKLDKLIELLADSNSRLDRLEDVTTFLCASVGKPRVIEKDVVNSTIEKIRSVGTYKKSRLLRGRIEAINTKLLWEGTELLADTFWINQIKGKPYFSHVKKKEIPLSGANFLRLTASYADFVDNLHGVYGYPRKRAQAAEKLETVIRKSQKAEDLVLSDDIEGFVRRPSGKHLNQFRILLDDFLLIIKILGIDREIFSQLPDYPNIELIKSLFGVATKEERQIGSNQRLDLAQINDLGMERVSDLE